MNWYYEIPYWENRKRVRTLDYFKKLVIDYFRTVEYDNTYGLSVIENKESQNIRHEINLCRDRIHSYVFYSGASSTVYYYPPPMIGGISGSIDLIDNIFNLHQFKISPQFLIDCIDRAIGIYENDKKNSFLRTLNPFFWIGKIIDVIVEMPFKFIEKIGFNREKIEISIAGRIFKRILYLILYFFTVGAAFLTILDKLGYLNDFKFWIQNLIK